MNDPLIDLLRDEAARRTASAPGAPSPGRVRLRARRRRRGEAAVAGAALVTALGAGALTVRPGAAVVPTQVAASPSPSLNADQHTRQEAEAAVQAAMDAFTPPAGWRQVDALQGADFVDSYPTPEHLVELTRFYVAPGTQQEVEAQLGHDAIPQPSRAEVGPDGSKHVVQVGTWSKTVRPISATEVGVRIDVFVAWFSHRPESTLVPETVTSAVMTRTHGGQVQERVPVPADKLRDAVRDVNAEHPDAHLLPPEVCPHKEGYRWQLTFQTPAGPWVYDYDQCGTGVLTQPDGTQTSLEQSVDLADIERALMHNPEGAGAIIRYFAAGISS